MITVYSTNCPLCIKLKNKLIESNIEFDYVELTQDEAIEKGFRAMPIMHMDGNEFNFTQAILYINKVRNGGSI